MTATTTADDVLAALSLPLLAAFHAQLVTEAARDPRYSTARDRVAAELAARPPTHRGETPT